LNCQPSLWQYLPFGGGTRYCIAANYAMNLLKVCLSIIVPKYQYSLPVGTQINRKTRIVMRPKQDVMMNIHAPDRSCKANWIGGKINEMIDINRYV
jgi:cytochrome P450